MRQRRSGRRSGSCPWRRIFYRRRSVATVSRAPRHDSAHASLARSSPVQTGRTGPFYGLLPSPGKGHKIYPYLLASTEVTRPGQVYAADITYIPIAKGFLYLAAVIDWHSRKVLAHRLSNALGAAVCLKTPEKLSDFSDHFCAQGGRVRRVPGGSEQTLSLRIISEERYRPCFSAVS